MRAHKIEELGGVSVWEWLGGPKIIAPGSPLYGAAAPAGGAGESYAAALKTLGLEARSAWTADEIKALMREVTEPVPIKTEPILQSVAGTDVRGHFSEANIRRSVGGALALLPPDVARQLGNINIAVVPDLGTALADWNAATGEIRLSRSAINGLIGDKKINVAERIFHELGHVIYDRGPQWYRDEIQQLWQRRTAGESQVWSQYGTYVKRDKWWDEYAGAIYPQGEGLEVVTRHLQLLANPTKMAKVMRRPNGETIAENLQIIMRVFYPRP